MILHSRWGLGGIGMRQGRGTQNIIKICRNYYIGIFWPEYVCFMPPLVSL